MDEKIRQYLLLLVKPLLEDAIDSVGLKKDDIIAWIEKHGGKISISEDLYEHIRKAKDCLDDMSNINDDYYNQAKFDLEDALKIIKTMEEQ
jgi:predicted CopG family antitoxin